MNIAPHKFNASLKPNKDYELVISSNSPFVERSTDESYIPGELLRLTLTADENGDLSVNEIEIPATNDTDIQSFTYSIALYPRKKDNEPIPFFFGTDGKQINKIRIPNTPTGEITWNQIRTENQSACHNTNQFQKPLITTEAAFDTFIRFSDLKQATFDFLSSLIVAGDGVEVIFDQSTGKVIISAIGGVASPENGITFKGDSLTFKGNFLTFK